MEGFSSLEVCASKQWWPLWKSGHEPRLFTFGSSFLASRRQKKMGWRTVHLQPNGNLPSQESDDEAQTVFPLSRRSHASAALPGHPAVIWTLQHSSCYSLVLPELDLQYD
jgi:hypothetical protein